VRGDLYGQQGVLYDYGLFFLCDDYFFGVDWPDQPTRQGQPASLYVDLRDALRTSQHLWKQIDYPRSSESIAITRAFSSKRMTIDLVILASGERRIPSTRRARFPLISPFQNALVPDQQRAEEDDS